MISSYTYIISRAVQIILWNRLWISNILQNFTKYFFTWNHVIKKFFRSKIWQPSYKWIKSKKYNECFAFKSLYLNGFYKHTFQRTGLIDYSSIKRYKIVSNKSFIDRIYFWSGFIDLHNSFNNAEWLRDKECVGKMNDNKVLDIKRWKKMFVYFDRYIRNRVAHKSTGICRLSKVILNFCLSKYFGLVSTPIVNLESYI